MARRFFIVGDQVRTVPHGRDPEDVIGEDFALALEVPAAPGENEEWDGKNWVRNAEKHEAHQRDAARRKGDWHKSVEARLAELERQMALLVAPPAGDEEG